RELGASKQRQQAQETAKIEGGEAAQQEPTVPQTQTAAAQPQPGPDDPLHQRLRQCDAYVDSNQLATGQDNALRCYTEVLHEEPDNAWALGGVARINEKYIGWARSSLARGDVDKTTVYLGLLARIDPAHESLPLLRLKLRALELSLQSGAETASTGSDSSVISAEAREKRYVELATAALDNRDAAKARDYIERLSNSNPQHLLLPRLKLRLRALELSQQSDSGQGAITVSSTTRSLSGGTQGSVAVSSAAPSASVSGAHRSSRRQSGGLGRGRWRGAAPGPLVVVGHVLHRDWKTVAEVGGLVGVGRRGPTRVGRTSDRGNTVCIQVPPPSCQMRKRCSNPPDRRRHGVRKHFRDLADRLLLRIHRRRPPADRDLHIPECSSS
ncbi:hypothetical protein N9H39_10210, partial [Gammaproteobacteria bacterium]|nr:hypothetical protein [Gammaproteobacteria bacterium]